MKHLNKFLATTVSRACGSMPMEGMMLGVELELEGPGVGLEGEATKGWRRTADGSLRGESIEFVLSTPKKYPDAVKAVDYLFAKFGKKAVKFNSSIRTSTHVHLNFADKPLRQAITFFCIFTMLEELLENYSGEDRAGNLFCLSSRRTDEIAGILQQCIREGSMRNFAGDRYKYAACNLSTLSKFGTVEVRTMRGADSAAQVNKWLSILNELYEYSLTVESPTDLVINLSHLGDEGFLNEVFSKENVQELLGAAPEGFNLYRSMLDGARLIQPLAYEFEEAFRFRPDPNAVVEEAPLRGAGCLRSSPLNGRSPTLRRLAGNMWNARGNIGVGQYFRHEEALVDCEDIRWNQDEFTFEEWDDDHEEWAPIPVVNNQEGFF